MDSLAEGRPQPTDLPEGIAILKDMSNRACVGIVESFKTGESTMRVFIPVTNITTKDIFKALPNIVV